jgi:hypothetical protein
MALQTIADLAAAVGVAGALAALILGVAAPILGGLLGRRP